MCRGASSDRISSTYGRSTVLHRSCWRGYPWTEPKDIENFQKSSLAKVQAICDHNTEFRHKTAAEFAVPETFTDFNKSNQRAEMDALIGSYTFLGRKPRVMDVPEALEMREAVRKSGRKFMIHFNQCFRPEHRCCKDVIEAGTLGNHEVPIPPCNPRYQRELSVKNQYCWKPYPPFERLQPARNMANLLNAEIDYHTLETRFGTWQRYLYTSGAVYSEFRSHTVVGGWPLVHITRGRSPETGKITPARGIVAIGQKALGVIAIGQAAVGIVAVGQLSIGLLVGIGQAATGILAIGQAAAGVFTIAQFGVGVAGIAQYGAGPHIHSGASSAS